MPAKKKVSKPKPLPDNTKTVAGYIRSLIMKGGMSDQQIYTHTKRKFPDLSVASYGRIAQYRSQLKKRGYELPKAKQTNAGKRKKTISRSRAH